MMMKNVLITGGAGYLGSILTPQLLGRGYNVTIIDNLLFNQNSLLDCCSSENFNFIRGDICDYQLMNKLISKNDVVIPLAAIVGAPACDQNPTLAKQVNYDAHINIIKNLSKANVILFPTTNSGYGVAGKDEVCTEESPLRPVSTYGRQKVEIEKAILDTGLATTFRLATVFGMSPRMRMDLLVNDFVYRAVKDRSIVLFEESFRRNYVHVRDVSRAFIFALENIDRIAREPYNVGLSSANLTKRQLCEKIKEHVPELVILTANVGVDPDKRDYFVSNEKFERLGWKAKFNLQDGIKELMKGYRMLKPNSFSNA
jgi:nucleoside-diphosphate-sugar epimerase